MENLYERSLKTLAGTTVGTIGTQSAGTLGNHVPRDVFAKVIFMGVHAKQVLANLASALAVDVEKGEGDTVKVRFWPKRTAQGPIAEGDALAETAIGTPTTKSVKIEAYGDRDTLTYQAMQFVPDDVKGRTLLSMGAAIGEKLEQATYDVLKNATPTTNLVLSTPGLINYDAVLKGRAIFKKAKLNADFLIVGPDHEVDLLEDSALTKVVDYDASVVSLPGEIGTIGGVRILVHPLANAKSAAAGAINGIMIDSSRAFCVAYGLPLTFEEQRIPERNQLKVVAWEFYGAAALDADAIVHLKNA